MVGLSNSEKQNKLSHHGVHNSIRELTNCDWEIRNNVKLFTTIYEHIPNGDMYINEQMQIMH